MPFQSRIFRKLLWRACVVLLLTFLAVEYYARDYTQQRETEHLREELGKLGLALSAEAANIPEEQLPAWVNQTAERCHIRVAVGAIASAPLDSNSLAVATPLPGIKRDLTISESLASVDQAVSRVLWRIAVASLIVACVTLIVIYLFARPITVRIRQLQRAAEGLIDPRALGELPSEEPDELGDVARSLRRVSRQLRDLLEKLSLESSQRQAILSSMVEGVLAVDQDFHVVFCNESFAAAIGIPVSVPERVRLLELVRDPGLLDLLTKVVREGETIKRRLPVNAAEGRLFEVQAAPLASASGRGAVAILHDITDLERLERVRKDFVANVSHELRTPLAAIRGYAETLLDGGLEDQRNNRRFVEIIQAHGIRLNNIASDLLVLSELESGRPEAPPTRVSIAGAIEAALRTVESEARLRSINLVVGHLDNSEVLGYKIRLEQAIVNLLDNAVKFNRPQGEVRIETALLTTGKVRLVISDNGVGIPSEDLPRIFERFYRVDKARSREVGGTGLGLSIVRHVLERMGGSIQVESQFGKGTKFTILLPAEPAPVSN